MHWFIFTSTGGCATIPADTITKAVSAFKKIKNPRRGEITGVIRAAAAMEIAGGVVPTPVFGVICCVAEGVAQQAIKPSQPV